MSCIDCQWLMFSDFYGECSLGYKGIVGPDDYCENFTEKSSPSEIAEVLMHCGYGGQCSDCIVRNKEGICKNFDRIAANYLLQYERLLNKEKRNAKRLF